MTDEQMTANKQDHYLSTVG